MDIILVKWGFADYISAFEDEGIDETSFPLLDDETINKIFPKAGPRLLFKKFFKEYIKNKENEINEISNINEITVLDIPSGSEIFNFASTPSSSFSFEPDEELLTVIEDEPPKKLLKRNSSIFPEGLEGILNKYTDGKLVLLQKDRLNNEHRQKLCKVIINEMISLFGVGIKCSQFVKVTEEIQDMFEREQRETYYIPYLPKGSLNKGSGPKGKLWSRFVNVRAALRLAASSSQKKDESVEVSPLKDKEKELIQYLKVATEPYTNIVTAWQDSYRQRKKFCLNMDIFTIFETFPCLRLNSGIELVEMDFNVKFPDKTKIIYSEWPKVADAILMECKDRKINVNFTEDKCVVAMQLLPYLFPPVTLKKSRKGINWRPTRTEIQESFFLFVQSFDELTERIALRSRKLQAYSLTAQPFAAVVNNSEYYIIINDVKYKVETGIRTLELLFKLFHALDVEYPKECEHVWLLVQELVYGIKSNKKSSATATVVTDISYHLKSIES